MGELAGRTVVVGVTGGIAAYKAADLVSKLAQAGASVRVVMTQHATEFVTPTTFQALSGNAVHTETFAAPEAYGMGHLSLAHGDALVVAPATANILAKAAAGVADDLLSTTLLAFEGPVLFVPAMNPRMWANPIMQRNMAVLREVGHTIVGPATGWVACREEGAGRMSEPAEILFAVRRALFPERDLAGRRVLVTAGPTREFIDPVRFLSNPSTGKQGYAIAEAALLRGAEVVLVSGPTSLSTPFGAQRVDVTTAEEMQAAVLAHCDTADLVVATAAVGDYTAGEPSQRKLPREGDGVILRLTPTPDIIASVAERKRAGQVLVGFAAETHDMLERAQEKLVRKGLELIVANPVGGGRGFAVDDNEVTLIARQGEPETLTRRSKLDVAHAVLQRAAALL